MSRVWRTKDIYKLIHLYRKHECLWDSRSDGYSRSDVKQEAWRRIALECNFSTDEVKKKIKNLRSTYVYEKRKVDKSKQNAKTADDVYEPHLYYYNEFKFLENICISRKIPEDSEQDNKYLTYRLADDITLEEEVTDPFNQYALRETEDEDSQMSAIIQSPELLTPSSDANSSSKEDSQTYSPKRVKKRRRDEKLDDALATLAAAVRGETTETVYTLFAKTIALQLQQLPQIEAIETMSEIYNLTSNKLLMAMRAAQEEKYL